MRKRQRMKKRNSQKIRERKEREIFRVRKKKEDRKRTKIM